MHIIPGGSNLPGFFWLKTYQDPVLKTKKQVYKYKGKTTGKSGIFTGIF